MLIHRGNIMSRTRLIKPALFENELLGQMDGDTVLTFIGLWCIADREGRLEDRPLRLKAKLFPYRQVSIENALSQLASGGFLIRYQVNGEPFVQIVNFEKHQHPHHKEQSSEIPPAPENLLTKEGRSTDIAPTKESCCPSFSLNQIPSPDSLNLKPSSPDGEQEVGIAHAIESNASKPRKAKPSPESDPDFAAFWEAYPVKIAKSEAFIEWQKAKLPAMDDILGAIEAQKEWRASAAKGEFRADWKHPSRWIKKECWNDQVTTSAREVSEYANF